jgi:hypothetical protein
VERKGTSGGNGGRKYKVIDNDGDSNENMVRRQAGALGIASILR